MIILCRDFEGRENDIRSNLNYFLIDILKLEISSMTFSKLSKGSNADKYAYMMRKYTKNVMKNNYVEISVEQFENYLKK